MESATVDFGFGGIAVQLKERLLAVPIYQRSYAWGDEQVREFWSDLRSAFAEHRREYFLGTVVLSRQGVQDRDTIIDGQQRIATTAILLAAIRDEYRNRGDEARAGIVQGDYLSKVDLRTATQVARLRLSSEDDHYFLNRIITGDEGARSAKPSHEMMVGHWRFSSLVSAKSHQMLVLSGATGYSSGSRF